MFPDHLPPIPVSDPGPRPLLNSDCGEPLVDLSVLSPDRIECRSAYYEQGLPGSIPTCMLRKGAAERLLKAAELLPQGWKFRIFDGWRPHSVQKALFDDYLCQLAYKEENQELTVRELMTLTREFVAFPSTDPLRPYNHGGGGAVDLTILNEKGEPLNMGTGFDDFTDLSHTRYFEEHDEDPEARDNRRLLYHVMI
ncbi:MAG: hypothetical protein IJD13_08985, partial [Oscillospiraceae bacterium]|nr:hypothetical protein [Oscillospiraceae bacterium]